MDLQRNVENAVVALLDNGSRLQAPAVATYIDRTRRAHPEESPTETMARLENLYLTTVTGSGGAVGAAAAVPGIGTIAALTASGAETLFFLEASALLTLACAAIHGIQPHDNEQRRALVLAVVLGDSGRAIVERAVGGSAKNWGSLLAGRLPGLDTLNESLLSRFILRFLMERGALTAGKVLPAGIGAVIGGLANRALGKGVIANARNAFGPPPEHWIGQIVSG
jgi:hypothetical protein